MRMLLIDRNERTPVRRQIYEQMKTQILCGELRGAEALPSTRQLADDLGISRSTVVEAYDMLLSEGFLLSRQGAPTVVAPGLVMERSPKPPAERSRETTAVRANFQTGRPDLVNFPRRQWGKALSDAALELPARQYGYTGPQGYEPLRREISEWLLRSRGFLADAEDVFITAGATQVLRILADLFCAGDGSMLMEDPCHKGLYDTLRVGGCRIVPVAADDHGMQTDRLPQIGRVDAVYVTPSHQFPMGGILPAGRRAALIRFARERNIYIIEDDYDSEFRFAGEPVAPLCAMDPQRVVYVGTFSKTLFPALRIGYVVLPKNLQARWRDLRTHHDIQNPPFEQAALAEFMKERKLDRHIRAMKKRYAVRREALMDALAASFGDTWRACGDAAGLHVAIHFSDRTFDEAFERRCVQSGVRAALLEEHCIVKGAHRSELVLGYGHLEPDRIRDGVRLLAEVMGTC